MCSEANDLQHPFETGNAGAASDAQAVKVMSKIGTPNAGTRPHSSLSVYRSSPNPRFPNTEVADYSSCRPCSPRLPSARNSKFPDLPIFDANDAGMRSFIEQDRNEEWNGFVVPPLWGAERANADILPWEQIQQSRQKYRKLLDAQVIEKSRLRKYRYEQELKLDRNTKTSLDTDNRSRDAECANADKERAIYKELIATVDYRQRAERERRRSEQQAARICDTQAELQMAWSWHVKREEEKQAKIRMAQEWSSAAQHRQQARELAKTLALREDKDFIERVNRGKLPRRRLRRARQECIASNHTPTRAHVAWAARS